VGDGAADFAAEKGISIVPHEYLIAEGAMERYQKWKADLDEVAETPTRVSRKAKPGAEEAQHESYSRVSEGFVESPRSVPARPSLAEQPLANSSADLPEEATLVTDAGHTPYRKAALYDISSDTETGENGEAVDVDMDWMNAMPARPYTNGSYDGSTPPATASDAPTPSDQGDMRVDNITDTVGAIAIDGWGNIAAGSSSGGIGMKLKGRCGPAALVNVGTAVIPQEVDDPEEVSVATVVSGTGEHMTTTAAAATAANRVYHSYKKTGQHFSDCSEDEALHHMIAEDFLSHPGVRTSPCPGAIGILAVKKSKHGIYFYFAHNTDSFALASMHSEERKPVCVMSRNKGKGSIAQGGRLSRSKYARRSS
jgi:taspase, threonine aspartase, 1